MIYKGISVFETILLETKHAEAKENGHGQKAWEARGTVRKMQCLATEYHGQTGIRDNELMIYGKWHIGIADC